MHNEIQLLPISNRRKTWKAKTEVYSCSACLYFASGMQTAATKIVFWAVNMPDVLILNFQCQKNILLSCAPCPAVSPFNCSLIMATTIDSGYVGSTVTNFQLLALPEALFRPSFFDQTLFRWNGNMAHSHDTEFINRWTIIYGKNVLMY